MRASTCISTATRIFSVEWNQNVAAVQDQLLPAASHFVFPDLPEVFSDQDKIEFSNDTDPGQQIHTVAACQHENAESDPMSLFNLLVIIVLF